MYGSGRFSSLIHSRSGRKILYLVSVPKTFSYDMEIGLMAFCHMNHVIMAIFVLRKLILQTRMRSQTVGLDF